MKFMNYASFNLPTLGWGIVPWMMIDMLGYFYIAGLNLIQHTNNKSAAAFA
jgi:hypothetical protein